MPQTYSPDEQKAIVQKMIDAGETEENIATVIQHFKTTPAAPTAPAPSYGMLDAAKDVGIGILKGAGSTAEHLGQLVHKIPGVSTAVDALYGTPGLSQAAFKEADRVTTPTNTPQALGKGAEQVAEVLVPGTMVSKATKGMGLAARMGAEAASSAGTALAQTADPTSAEVSGVIGAAAPLVGSALGTKTATALKESAEKRVAQALGATKERFKAIAERRAPEIIKRGLGGTRAMLLKDATEHAAEAGKAIDEVLQGAGDTRISTKPVLDALEEAKQAYQIPRRVPIAEAIRTGAANAVGATDAGGGFINVPVTLDARPVRQLSQLQDIIRNLGDDASVSHLVATRRAWDQVVAQAGGFAHRSGSTFGLPLKEQSEAWAKREATDAIRKVLAEEVPDIAKANKEFSFWKDLQDVLTATQARTQPQGTGLNRIVSASVGAGAGYSSGDNTTDRLKNAAIGAFITPRILSGLQSARWKFVDARLRNALADAIASGSPGRVMSAATRVLAVQSGKAAASPTSE